MTSKNKLLIIIKQKGDCNFPVKVNCNALLGEETCPVKDSYSCAIHLKRYKKAIDEYVKKYGRDIELMEVLI